MGQYGYTQGKKMCTPHKYGLSSTESVSIWQNRPLFAQGRCKKSSDTTLIQFPWNRYLKVNAHRNNPSTLQHKNCSLAIADIRKEVQKDSISTTITHRQWSDFGGKSNEETSSSRSGRHFGNYIAGASLKLISHHHAMKTSIVVRQGISLERWSQGLSVMLEKVKGCSLVSKLRSTFLMEVDFNYAKKILYGVGMLDNARRHTLMPGKIFSEKNRMADDGSLAKTLFYDLVHQSRHPAGLSLVDANNCYDRIAHTIASVLCQSFGVPQEVIRSMLHMIQEMKIFLCAA
jgi:hypothetical protein